MLQIELALNEFDNQVDHRIKQLLHVLTFCCQWKKTGTVGTMSDLLVDSHLRLFAIVMTGVLDIFHDKHHLIDS